MRMARQSRSQMMSPMARACLILSGTQREVGHGEGDGLARHVEVDHHEAPARDLGRQLMPRDGQDPVAGEEPDAVPGKDQVPVHLLGPVVESAVVSEELRVVLEVGAEAPRVGLLEPHHVELPQEARYLPEVYHLAPRGQDMLPEVFQPFG
jgi:hypothetical protein